MTKNVGTLDRIIRVVLAVGLGIWGSLSLAAGWPAWLAIAAGLILLGTAAIGFCPIWRVLGVKTISIKKL